MELIKMNIEDIVPYENNAKLHPEEQIEQIKRSILEFGNNDPIAVDNNNVVVEGHGRLLALKKLGYKEVDVIKLGHLNEQQRKAYTLIHNKLTMNTDFDFNILEKELSEIVDFDMGAFDFDVEGIDDTFGTDFELSNEDKSELEQMTFTLHHEQAELVKYSINQIDDYTETFGNTNKNGNALYEMVKQWAEQKTL